MQDEWFKTPRQELGGKTPEEIILQEREKMGNPQKSVKFKVFITSLNPGEEIGRKMRELFNRGIQLMKENKPAEAIKVYKEHLFLHPQNYIVWQNIGVAHMLLRDKKNAKRCFQKALEINPEYEIAKNNLKFLAKATQSDLTHMAREYKVKWMNEDKEIEL